MPMSQLRVDENHDLAIARSSSSHAEPGLRVAFKCLKQSLHSNYQGTGYDRSVTDGHNKSPSEIIYTLNPRSDTANYRLG